jgi:membrane fusion protein, multidrug efflux system
MEKQRQSQNFSTADRPEVATSSGKIRNGLNSSQSKWYRKKSIVIPILLLILGAAAITAYWYLELRGFISTDDAYIDGDRVSLSAKMLGRIAQLAVDEGDTVQPGQRLVQLDDADLRAQEAQAQANLDYARQNVNLATVNLQRAQDDFQRAAVQIKDHIIPQEQYDHAQKALEVARAQHGIVLAQVQTANAQLRMVQTQLENTHITAPFAGVVARRWVIAGDVVQPGQPIYTIYDVNNIWVTANFEETKIFSIHPGDPVEISVDAYSGQTVNGKVILIGAAAASQFSLIPPNTASGNFTKVTQRVPVKISITNRSIINGKDPALLLPGMSVEVKVRTVEE